jgi:hypothetical protein
VKNQLVPCLYHRYSIFVALTSSAGFLAYPFEMYKYDATNVVCIHASMENLCRGEEMFEFRAMACMCRPFGVSASCRKPGGLLYPGSQ